VWLRRCRCGRPLGSAPPPGFNVKCNPAKMTPRLCGSLCHSMGIADQGKPYRLVGLEDGSQCFCDNEMNSEFPQGIKRAPLVECNAPW
jgi:hypothetical protein